MVERVRLRFWFESTLAALNTALALLTMVRKDWIEAAFGIDPDQHSGAMEWLIVVAALAIAVSAVALARREWRRRAVAVA